MGLIESCLYGRNIDRCRQIFRYGGLILSWLLFVLIFLILAMLSCMFWLHFLPKFFMLFRWH